MDRPAGVWGRAAQRTRDAAAPVVETPAVAPAVVVDVPAVAPADETVGVPVVVDEPIPAVVAAPTPAAPPAAEPIAAPGSRRRARREATSPQPIVEVPDIGSVALAAEEPAAIRTAPIEPAVEPAPLLETVLTPAEPFELLEPTAVALETEPETLEPIAAEPVEEPEAEPSIADEFELAARLFSFTGETPVQDAATPADETVADDSDPAAGSHAVTRGSRGTRGAALKRVSAASFSVGVMGIVGLLTVGMTTPAEAVAAASGADVAMSVVAPEETDAEVVPEDEIQAYVAPAEVQNVDLARTENYSTTTMAELAYESGIQNVSNFFVNDPNAPIQWPFAVGVPITYGFGMRSGRMHEGVDFTPGAGSPIQAIADGVVREASSSGGAYGVHVIIDHVIDGQLVSSHYAHMQYGSLQVQPGQQVTVGTILGRTGNTGRSYGAHTHFEILIGGTTPIDPIPWLRQHAGG
ncbi:MAG: M23 family metallopeptidase [Microbacterium sp.]